MASILDKYNEHLFLEHNSNKSNSFIANVNLIASKFDELVRIDEKFDAEAVKLLIQLVKNALDINIKQIAEDLRKGSYDGYRKLDIDLLTNFAEYDYFMTDAEKNALWSDETKQVYYSSVDVYLADGSVIHKDFSSDINNHHQLYTELNDWVELKEAYNDTLINISPNTPIPNHELLRIVDSSLQGSFIEKVVLNVALAGKDPAYDAVFVGAKSHHPEFAWMDTTSALITIAHKVNDILYTANYIEQLGGDIEEMFQSYLAQVREYADLTSGYANSAASYAAEALEVLERQRSFIVTSVTQAHDTEPRVNYDPNLNKITFGLPRSEVSVIDFTSFAVNTINGHLTLETKLTSSDIDRVYLDEDNGRFIVELKK